jgi:hypothetical protein
MKITRITTNRDRDLVLLVALRELVHDLEGKLNNPDWQNCRRSVRKELARARADLFCIEDVCGPSVDAWTDTHVGYAA